VRGAIADGLVRTKGSKAALRNLQRIYRLP
jgi:hypothetical protein